METSFICTRKPKTSFDSRHYLFGGGGPEPNLQLSPRYACTQMIFKHMKLFSCTHNLKICNLKIFSGIISHLSGCGKNKQTLRTHLGRTVRKQYTHTHRHRHALLVRTQNGKVSAIPYKIVHGFTH